jgi:hypothetical protein
VNAGGPQEEVEEGPEHSAALSQIGHSPTLSGGDRVYGPHAREQKCLEPDCSVEEALTRMLEGTSATFPSKTAGR